MAISTLELDIYIQSIIDFLTPLFPEIQHFGHYDRINDETFVTPAILVQVDNFDADNEQPANGVLKLLMTTHILIMDSFAEPNIRMNLRKKALAIAAKIHAERFSQSVTPAVIRNVSYDPFDANYDAYETMRIEFTQSAYFGTIPAPDGVSPENIFVGIAPEIGIPNEDKYKKITQE